MTFFNADRKREDVVLDAIAGVAGVALALAPWLLGFMTATTAVWNAWIVGAALLVVALVAIFAATNYEPRAFLVLGAWAIVAPWVLGFAGLAVALWSHVIAGALAVFVAAFALWFSHNRPMTA